MGLVHCEVSNPVTVIISGTTPLIVLKLTNTLMIGKKPRAAFIQATWMLLIWSGIRSSTELSHDVLLAPTLQLTQHFHKSHTR